MTAASTSTRSPTRRFVLGLGTSGPQVAEGWHGVSFDRPVARSREYVDVVRAVLAREVVTYEGSSTSGSRCPTGPTSR